MLSPLTVDTMIRSSSSAVTSAFSRAESAALYPISEAVSTVLILLSDIEGLYTADPRSDKNAKLITEVETITPEIVCLAKGAGTTQGTGGMQTKIHAAQIATKAGVNMVIANGNNPLALYDIVDGKKVGTLFKAEKR